VYTFTRDIANTTQLSSAGSATYLFTRVAIGSGLAQTGGSAVIQNIDVSGRRAIRLLGDRVTQSTLTDLEVVV